MNWVLDPQALIGHKRADRPPTRTIPCTLPTATQQHNEDNFEGVV
jgi:hypothetical protein